MAQRSINSDAEYERALTEIERFFDNEPEKGSAEAAARMLQDRQTERKRPVLA